MTPRLREDFIHQLDLLSVVIQKKKIVNAYSPGESEGVKVHQHKINVMK